MKQLFRCRDNIKFLPYFKNFLLLFSLLFSFQISYSQTCVSPPSVLVNGNFELPPGAISPGNAGINVDMPGWFVSNGTPSTAATPPRSMWMWSYSSIGEGVFNCFDFRAGREYLICFDLITNGKTNGATFNVQAATGLNPYTGTIVGTPLPTPTTSEQIFQDLLPPYTSLTNVSVTYSPSANFTEIWFYPFMSAGPGGTPPQATGRIDNVVIQEINPADYTVSPNATICPPNSVQLTATGGTSYQWSPSTGLSCTNCPNPVASPVTTTTYTVEIFDPANCGPVTREVTVTIDCPCQCELNPDFNFAEADTCTEVNFSSTSTSSFCTDILGYYWDFGDGNIGFGSNVTHNYNAEGTYDVCLKIIGYRDSIGCCEDSICYPVQIKCDTCTCNVISDFNFRPNLCTVDFFEQSSLGDPCGSIIGWEWDFGDGNGSTSPNPTHTYATSGTYFACLTTYAVADGDTCENIFCREITVECPECECVIEPNFDFIVDKCKVNFIDKSIYDTCLTILSWSWDFGDGNGSNLQNPMHTYAGPGVYVVCMTITGTNGIDTCSYEICQEVPVEDCEPCPCTIEPDFFFEIGDCGEVQFINNSNSDCEIIGYKWDFGDSTYASVPDPFHYYDNPGVYEVCLTVTVLDPETGRCCEETICYEIEVPDQCPPCECPIDTMFFNYQLSGCDIQFDLVVESECDIFDFLWDFGDGNTDMGNPSPNHTYAHNGVYCVCVTVLYNDDSGRICSETVCDSIIVTECKPAPCSELEPTVVKGKAAFNSQVEDPNSFGFNIYPNPTSGELTIEFTTITTGKVEVSIHDGTGKLISTLINSKLESGQHSVSWNAAKAGVAQGVYYVSIKAGENNEYQKIVFKE